MKPDALKGKVVTVEGDITGTVTKVFKMGEYGWHLEMTVWRHPKPSVFPLAELTHVEGKRVEVT